MADKPVSIIKCYNKGSYKGPFTYEKASHTIRNEFGQSVCYVSMAHMRYTFNHERDAFGELLTQLLNDYLTNQLISIVNEQK